MSISLVVGENGVLTQASGASDTTKIAQMKEACGLAMSSCQAAYFNAYANNASSEPSSYINAVELSKALQNQGYILCTSDGTSVGDSTELSAAVRIYAKPASVTNGTTKAEGDCLGVKFTLNNFTITATYGNDLKGTAPSGS
ncbi:MAG: hypothetical protein IJ867_00475 [Clostridia bacterium]|nr:hypothetical protein [Clostridia bacterium]